MKFKLYLIFFCISIGFLSCKKESANTDDIQFTANANSGFVVSLIIAAPKGGFIAKEQKTINTEPYTYKYSLNTLKKGSHILIRMETLGGYITDATLNVKGNVVEPQNNSTIFTIDRLWETNMP